MPPVLISRIRAARRRSFSRSKRPSTKEYGTGFPGSLPGRGCRPSPPPPARSLEVAQPRQLESPRPGSTRLGGSCSDVPSRAILAARSGDGHRWSRSGRRGGSPKSRWAERLGGQRKCRRTPGGLRRSLHEPHCGGDSRKADVAKCRGGTWASPPPDASDGSAPIRSKGKTTRGTGGIQEYRRHRIEDPDWQGRGGFGSRLSREVSVATETRAHRRGSEPTAGTWGREGRIVRGHCSVDSSDRRPAPAQLSVVSKSRARVASVSLRFQEGRR